MAGLIDRLGLPNVAGRAKPVAAVALDALGSGIFMPFTVLYFARETTVSLARIGLYLSIAAALALPVAPLFGGLIDRFGARPVIVLTNLAMLVGYLSYPGLKSGWPIVLAVFLVTTADTVYWAAAGAFAVQLADDGELTRWYGMERTLRNAGYAVGGAVGSLLVVTMKDGLLAVGLLNAASYAAAGLMVLLWRPASDRPGAAAGAGAAGAAETGNVETGNVETGNAGATRREGYREVLRDRPFLVLVAAQFPLILTLFVPSTLMPLYAVEETRAPVWLPGVLVTLNTVLLVLAQTVAARRLERLARTRVLQLCAAVWVLSFALFALARAGLPVLLLTVAMLVYTCAQLAGNTAGSPLLAAMAPSHLRGRYLSVSSLSWSVSQVLAPGLLVGSLSASPLLPWLLLAAGCGASIPLVQWLHRMLPDSVLREPPRPGAEQPEPAPVGQPA